VVVVVEVVEVVVVDVVVVDALDGVGVGSAANAAAATSSATRISIVTRLGERTALSMNRRMCVTIVPIDTGRES
jgi:hypothetical protein